MMDKKDNVDDAMVANGKQDEMLLDRSL